MGRQAAPTGWRTSDTLVLAPPDQRTAGRRWASFAGVLVVVGLTALGYLLAPKSWSSYPGPPPGLEETAVRVMPPPVAPAGGEGKYRFLNVSSDGQPMAFSPCRPIHFVIRPDHAPKGGAKLIKSAIADVSIATGISFVFDGTTDEPVTNGRESYQPDRYGDRWAPVLIAWATPDEVPEFSIDVVGQAGPAGMSRSDGVSAYVSGQMYLDPEGIRQVRSEQGTAAARGIVLHELGHLMGLDHVPQQDQLMFPRASGAVTTYQAGDLAGLARLGNGPCQPQL